MLRGQCWVASVVDASMSPARTPARPSPFKLSDGDNTMVALSVTQSAQTLYVLLRGLEQKNLMDVTITSYGQAVPAQDVTQRSYTFPNAKPAEAVEYVLGPAKGNIVQDKFFRPGAHAP